MKKPTIFKALIAVVFLLLSLSSYSQVREGFKTEYSASLNGDILVIGNNILNRDENKRNQRANDAFDDVSKVNDNFEMKYIDIDGDGNTFNSSSATLVIPQASRTCYEIVYAALYWAGTYQGADRSKIANVKLKTPKAGAAYKPLTGTIIYDEGKPGVTNVYASKPYACFKEITDEVKDAKDGVYTVADIMTSEGKVTPGGNSGGWSIFVVYKDPLLPNKFITSFNGFGIIRASDPPLVIPVSGFRTNPFGDVNAKLAFAALEGDASLKGDGLSIQGAKSATAGNISSLVRPIAPGTPGTPNFFNSTITDGDVILAGRTPGSINTLGYDTGVVKIDNTGNTIIQNNETDANLTINTSQDSYYMFFTALSVEIIAPKIVLRKNVLDTNDKNIGAQSVNLDQELRYELKFKNEGNDSAKGFTITDVLPQNVIFNGLSDIMVMDKNITASYDAATRTLLFTVPDYMVVSKQAGGSEYTIKFKVRVVKDCNELVDACSNEIKNTAVSKYFGVLNTTKEGFGEGSYSTISECNVGEPTSTNFLVGIDKCLFSRDVSLCGTAVLTAALGYTTYVWKDQNGVIFGGNNRQVTVNKEGVYTVENSGAVNCKPIKQTFNVTDYLKGTIKNPIKGDNIDPATGEAYGCVRDKKPFPKIFLCGLNDKRFIDTKIVGATSITWQETKDVPPASDPNPDSCPYEGATNWTTLATGPTYTVDKAGVFRLLVNYGNTCVVMHYFNVYQNLLDPKAEKQDIICDTKGQIRVTNPPENSGYVYSLDGINYQPESTFNNVAEGSYKVQIRQSELINGVISTCPFFVDVDVEKLDLVTKLEVTNPICTGDLGTIKANIENVPGDYKFILRKKGSTVEIENTGFIKNNYKVFTGVEPGFKYEVLMSTTHNGCAETKEIEVFDYRLTASAKLTKNLSACGDGQITVTVTGGTPRPGPPPYYMYYVNGNPDYFTTPDIPVTLATLPADGKYNIVVVDDKGCKVTIPTITVVPIAKPTITVTPSEVFCYGANSGNIKVDVTPADSGYTVSYSIDGVNFNSISPITNLTPGDYSLIVKYSYDNVECVDPARPVTIKGPAFPLTASAGVSELAGCGLPGFEYQGKVRITNPQGGTPFYKYSFDGQKTWIDENEAYVNPGTHTLYIKDSKDCIYAMSGVVLDPKPADPTIALDPTVYNCNGTGKTTATVTNSGGKNYTYEYYIDGKPNTPITNNVFDNVITGSHTISVKYKLVSVPTYSNLLREDFGTDLFTYTATSSPDGSSPGINPAFCWERQIEATKCNADRLFANGEYTVTSSLRNNPYHGWQNPIDHTSNSRTGGRYLAVDAGTAIPNNAVLYRKTIKDIIPGQPIQVKFFATNLLKVGNPQPDASLTVELQNAAGVPLSSQSTGKIPKTNGWVEYNRTIDPGSNSTLDFVLRLEISQVDGIDFAVDDIEVYQLPKSCVTEKKFDIIIDSNKAFKPSEPLVDDATCSDKNDGKITLTVENFDTVNGYKYSIDNGVTWNTATVSPFTISGLGKGIYNVIIKNDDAGLCSSSFSKEIKAPLTLTTTASITTPPTCKKGASITAIPGGGTPKYQYELRLADGITPYRAFQDLATFDDVPDGTYTVVVRDKSTCSSTASDVVTVTSPVKPTIELDVTSDLCYDVANKATLIVKVNGGKAPFNYSLDGQPSQKTNTFINVAPGTHSITVIDANLCEADAITGIQIGKPIVVNTKVTKPIDCTGTPDAEITVTATEGIAPYTYEVSTDGGTTFNPMLTNVYKTQTVGSYIFKVTDSKGCSATGTAVNVVTKLEPTGSIVSQTNPKCNNDANGQFTVSGSGGSGAPYEFSFDGGGFSTTSTYSNLDAFVGAVNSKKYTYQVKDSKGCLSPVYDVILNNPTKVEASATFPANTNCSSTVIITSKGDGGSGTYTYSFGGSTTYTGVNTLTVTLKATTQDITYSVKDAQGCIDTDKITVPAFNAPTKINFSVPAAITCNLTSTSITLTTTGGIAPYKYEITAGPVTGNNTTGIFTGLTPGSYSFKVTDANGCSITDTKTINGATTISASGSKTDELCVGDKNGTATFTVNGVSSTGNFTYTLTPNAGTPSLTGNVVTYTGLPSGTYNFEAIDKTTGCKTDSEKVVIDAATAIDFTVTASKINCSTTVSTLDITGITGGRPGYEYAYAASPSTVPTTAYGTTLKVDTAILTTSIDVYVKDLNNCFKKKTVTVLAEDAPKIDPVATQCYTGTPISVTITGTYVGTATFSKDGVNYGTSNTFNLTPGTYTLSLKDGFGCPASISYTVAEKLTITPEVVEDIACTPNTTIKLTSAGGTGTHTYAVSFNNGTYTTTTSPYTATVAGNYKFKVTDSANPACSAETAVIPVTLKPTVLTIKVDKTHVKCNGGSTGTILVTPTSGKAPYTYTITRQGTPATVYTVNNPSGVTEGVYDIVVKDAIGCEVTDQVTITEPTKLVVTANANPFTCDVTNTKQGTSVIIDLPNTGTAPYTYSFNGGSFTGVNTLPVTDNGADQIIKYAVMDANGCTASGQLTINKLDPPKITKVDVTPIYCNPATSQTSTATISLSRAILPTDSFVIVAGPVVNTTGATTGVFTGLTAGNYTFRVIAGNKCYDDFFKNIPPVDPFTAIATKLNDVYCFATPKETTGNIRYNVGGFKTTYSYTVNGGTAVTGQTAAIFTLPNLGEGKYDVVFTDETTLCIISTSITITQPTDALTLTVDSNKNANCKVSTATVTVSATGGTPDYKYAFVQNNVTPLDTDYKGLTTVSLNPAITTDWDVWVKDSKDCTYKVDLKIAMDTKPTVTVKVPNQCTASGNTFQIVATGADGVAPYTYSISTGAAPSPADTFTVSAGTYTITVTDANGCTGTIPVTVYDALAVRADLDKDLTCTALAPTDATITVKVVSGGKAGFSYKVKFNGGAYSATGTAFAGTSFPYTTSAAGTYQFEITDANGCTKETAVITVSTPDTVTASATPKNPTCNGDTDGSVTLKGLTGVGPFKYIFNGSALSDQTVYGGLAAGTYSYTVRDAKGCEIIGTVTLLQPAKIDPIIKPWGITCSSTQPGSIDVSLSTSSGGTAPFIYHLYDNNMKEIGSYTANTTADANAVHNFPALPFGDYYLNIVDANGCKFESNAIRIEPLPYLKFNAQTIGANCTDGVSVKLEVTGGTAPFIYSIYGIGTTSGSTTATDYTFIKLDQNTKYTFLVVDSGGCPSYLDYTTGKISDVTVTATTKNVTCFNAANGEVTFSVKQPGAGVTNVYYELRDNLTNKPFIPGIDGTTLPASPFDGTITNLKPGNYTLYIKEIGGTMCSTTTIFRITEPASELTADFDGIVNANCRSNAFVTIKAKGGTGPYTYAAALAPTVPNPGALDTSNVLELPYDAATSNNFNIIVKDANGCTYPLTLVITKDESPIIGLSVANKCAAEDNYGIVVALNNVGVTPYAIKVDSGDFVTYTGTFPYTITGLHSGDHTVTIKDKNDCTDTKTIKIDAPLLVVPEIITHPDCGTSNGEILLKPSGGSGSYAYNIFPPDPSIVITGNSITGLKYGKYTVTMSDVNNVGCSTTADFELKEATPVTFDAVVTHPLCKTDANGTITVNLLPGNDEPTYTYVITSATATPLPIGITQADNVFSNIPDGKYTITVTSGKKCFTSHTYDVIEPAVALGASVVFKDFGCTTGSTPDQAVVTVTGTGGTGPYAYNFDGSDIYTNVNSISVSASASAQTVNYYVIDKNGCKFSGTQNIAGFIPLDDIKFDVTTAPTCPLKETTITLTVVGGYAISKYEMISPVYKDNGTSAVFANLTAGNYMFKVTDARNCSIERPYKIEPLNPIDIVKTSSLNVSCNTANGTDNNGEATFTVSSFSASGNYDVVVTSTPAALPYNTPTIATGVTADVITVTGLVQGTYTVTVTDKTTLCSKGDNVTITMPAAIDFTPNATTVYCSQQDSQITVTGITGGTPNYKYAVVKAGDPKPTTFGDISVPVTVATALTDLDWDVYVQDANGCVSLAKTVSAQYDAAPVLNVPAQQCFKGTDITIDFADALISTTYNGNKTFTVNGLATGSSITFKDAGKYTIVLTDDHGCSATIDYIIEKELTVSATIKKELFCTGAVDAIIDVEIKGGKGSYQYQMYYNGAVSGGVTNTAGDFSVSVSLAGDYHFEITDSNSPVCPAVSLPVTVEAPVIPKLTPSQINVKCFTDSNGELTVVPSDGVAPYTFTITGPVNHTGDTSGTYTGLKAGFYDVTATDAKGCSNTVNIEITEPKELTADAAFPPNTTCSIATVITVTGHDGTPTGIGTGYYYNFNNTGYDTVNTFTVNDDDNGTVQTVWYTVKDKNGCETAPQSIVVQPLNKPSALSFAATAVTCAAATSDVTVTATNGVGALEFKIIEINGVTGTYTAISTTGNAVPAVFTGLLPGDYKFMVTDSNGCSYTDSFTVKDVVKIQTTGQATDKTCVYTDDGTATFTVSDFEGTYTYTITKNTGTPSAPVTTSLTEIVLTNLTIGDYKISVVDDATQCPSEFTVTVKDPIAVTVTEEGNVNANCTTFATVTVAGHGGIADYTYSFVPAGAPYGTFTDEATRKLNPATAAWYVYAMDQKGCISAPITVNITTDPLPAGFTATVTTQCADALGNYEIVVTPGTGMGPFTYSIGGGFQSELEFIVKAPGTYDLVVKDKFGCPFTFTAAVTILQPVDLVIDSKVLPTCKDGDGEVTVTATGGTGNFSYTIDGGITVTTTPAVFDKLTAGSHTIIVTDLGANNCTDKVTFELKAATEITGFKVVATNVSCFNGNDGTITASLDPTSDGVNDNPIYMYSIDGGTPQDDPVFKGLIAGDYIVSVISGRGCTDDFPVKITQPDLIVVPTPDVVQYLCTTDNVSNFATITVNGVTGGTKDYTYTFIKAGTPTPVYVGPRNFYTETDYAGGTYTITVTDRNNCSGAAVGTFTIDPFIAMDKVVIDVNQHITCAVKENITVTVKSKAGVNVPGTFKYTLTGINGTVYGPIDTTDGIFTGLEIGNYLVTVLNTVTGCTIQNVHFISDPNTFEIQAVPVASKICYGTSDGKVVLTFVDNQLNPSNDAGAFDYTITGVTATGPVTLTGSTTDAGPFEIGSLKAGTYNVIAKLKGTPTCEVTTVFTIDQPTAELIVTKTQSEITCLAGNNDGVIVASATGGWPGQYLYQLVDATTNAEVRPYSASPVFDKLMAGNYKVNVIDGFGCIASVNASLVNPTPISITISATPMLTCFDNEDGVLTINTINGGSGNYIYTLHGVLVDGTVITAKSQGAKQFTDLKAGTYYITVNDSWTCTNDSNKVTIAEPALVKATVEIFSTETCKNPPVIILRASGGTPPYTYSADGINNLGTFASFTTITLPVTNAKTEYKYFVQDSKGCKSYVSNTTEFLPVPELGFERESKIDIRCKGGSTGSITVLAKGGLGNYIYTLQNGAGVNITPAPVQTTPGSFTNLPIGDYIVKVTSLDCSVPSMLFKLTEPNAPLEATAVPTDLTCNGFNNGKITVNAKGGTGIYKYAIEPEFRQFFDKNVFENLKPGFYDILVQDENECYIFLKDVEVKEPGLLIATEIPNSMIPEVCVGDKNGAFSIEITGGTAPYTESLDNDKGPYLPVTGNTRDYTGLTGGMHTVYIIDSKGCTSEVVIDMPLPVVLDPTAEVNYDCVDNKAANRVTITVDESITDLSEVDYQLDGTGAFQTSNIFINVAPGNHFVVARHTNGCEVPTASFNIIGYEKLVLSLSEEKGVWNVITATAVGGGGDYMYSIDGGSFTTENKFKIYKTGTYTITVRDKNGCTDTKEYFIKYVDVCLDNYFTPNGDGVYDTWGPGCTNIYNNLEFSIFDRYGRVIAKYHYGQKWDGRYNGEELPSGDYWYVLKLNDENDGREFVGHFTLYR
ncbi:T9SS type B sorting domain-containing protein [Flavobacterium branchiicola]|uniref:T9SS type B sorting domain-containing protein n=1 Tax=Flavobacterium branchiicola TaxID=1114875 RepID=A0ABV9PHB8_9FLAO|nr:T9SS type B sorting domain-containing protein [Flavobacterium branchiicola]MBS7255246.1 T9SS type B sorting domain-containing protein [Flavobacterium branchiicola]